MLKRFFRIAPDESDLLLCAGVESLFYGTLQIFPPAAYILIGVAFTALAFIQARGGN